MSHPENFLSQPGGPGYDPDEPLLAPWGVIIGARNAVAWLCAEMGDADRWQDRQDWSWISRHLVAAVENTNPEHEPRIDTREGVIEWLERLRDRLNMCLPRSLAVEAVGAYRPSTHSGDHSMCWYYRELGHDIQLTH